MHAHSLISTRFPFHAKQVSKWGVWRGRSWKNNIKKPWSPWFSFLVICSTLIDHPPWVVKMSTAPRRECKNATRAAMVCYHGSTWILYITQVRPCCCLDVENREKVGFVLVFHIRIEMRWNRSRWKNPRKNVTRVFGSENTLRHQPFSRWENRRDDSGFPLFFTPLCCVCLTTFLKFFLKVFKWS